MGVQEHEIVSERGKTLCNLMLGEVYIMGKLNLKGV